MSVACPKCGQLLDSSGEVSVDGQAMAVYQCETCVEPWKIGDAEFPAALTFALDADGRYLDATTFELFSPPFDPSDN